MIGIAIVLIVLIAIIAVLINFQKWGEVTQNGGGVVFEMGGGVLITP